MFKPGNKFGVGRLKGSKNRITEEIRKAFLLLIEKNLPEIERWLAQIKNPKDRIDCILKLATLTIPKPLEVDCPAYDRNINIRIIEGREGT